MSFYQACRIGNLKKVKDYLYFHDFDINTQNELGYTGLHYACFYGKIKIVKYLIEELGADLEMMNLSNSTPFLVAVENNQYNVVKYLLNIADISIFDKFGYNALHKAIYNNNIQMIKLLMSANDGNEIWIDPRSKLDYNYFSAIEYAKILHKNEILDLIDVYFCISGTQ